jgi:DNA ligase-associated metallophosphoesterase
MKLAEQQISFGKHHLTLTNQRAVFWGQASSLILADIHLGKAAYFRRNGIAIPSGVAAGDLKRLTELICHYSPRQVIFVGDLIHAGTNTEVEAFCALIKKFTETKFILVRGNHDRIPSGQLSRLGLDTITTTLETEGLLFSHEPSAAQSLPVICGHIHPGIRIRLPDKKTLALPCYVVSESQLLLPAFSLFTGLSIHAPLEDSVCYAFHETDFFTLPALPLE